MKLELTAEYVRDPECYGDHYDPDWDKDEVRILLDGEPVVKLPVEGGNAKAPEDERRAVLQTVGAWFENVNHAVQAIEKLRGI